MHILLPLLLVPPPCFLPSLVCFDNQEVPSEDSRQTPNSHLYILPSLCWSSSSSLDNTKGSLISGRPDSASRFFFRPRGALGVRPPAPLAAPPSERTVAPFLERSGTTWRVAWEPGGSAETIMGAEMGKVCTEAAVVTKDPEGDVITRPGPAGRDEKSDANATAERSICLSPSQVLYEEANLLLKAWVTLTAPSRNSRRKH